MGLTFYTVIFSIENLNIRYKQTKKTNKQTNTQANNKQNEHLTWKRFYGLVL